MNLETFEERFDYLKLWDSPHVSPDDILYRKFLKSRGWILFREDIIARDFGQDLAVPGRLVESRIIIHHMNPITTEDILSNDWRILFNPDTVITTSIDTHNNIHYKPIDTPKVVLERYPGDTKLW